MPCVFSRLAGRLGPTGDPRLAQGQVHLPASAVLKAPWFGIGQSLAPRIIRIRYGAQPDEKAARALRV